MGLFLGFGFFEDEIAAPNGKRVRRNGETFVLRGEDGSGGFFEGQISARARVVRPAVHHCVPVPLRNGVVPVDDRDAHTIIPEGGRVLEELPPLDPSPGCRLDALGEGD